MATKGSAKRQADTRAGRRARRNQRTVQHPKAIRRAAGLGAIVTLQEFMNLAGRLTTRERQRIVEQALVLVEDIYVHLPLKRAMHAVDPVQRLKLLAKRLESMSERRFHDEMIDIFTELRDLHTNYVLPEPFRSRTAFLPFLLEEFFEKNNRRYIVSKVFQGFSDEHFVPGVIVSRWNGIPIDRAIELNADRNAGSNEDARHARGLESMTIRPMALSAPPDEEWVVVGFQNGSEQREIRIDWRVFAPDAAPSSVDPDSAKATSARSLGVDALTERVRRAKKALFAPKAMEQERKAAHLWRRHFQRPQSRHPQRKRDHDAGRFFLQNGGNSTRQLWVRSHLDLQRQ